MVANTSIVERARRGPAVNGQAVPLRIRSGDSPALVAGR
jgi:hypothetical protein